MPRSREDAERLRKSQEDRIEARRAVKLAEAEASMAEAEERKVRAELRVERLVSNSDSIISTDSIELLIEEVETLSAAGKKTMTLKRIKEILNISE